MGFCSFSPVKGENEQNPEKKSEILGCERNDKLDFSFFFFFYLSTLSTLKDIKVKYAAEETCIAALENICR